MKNSLDTKTFQGRRYQFWLLKSARTLDILLQTFSDAISTSIHRGKVLKKIKFTCNFSHVKFMEMKFFKQHEDDREMYYRNLDKSEMEKHSRHFDDANAARRKASIDEFSEDEIVFAYNKLKAEKIPNTFDARARNEDLSTEMKEEFLRWMDKKRRNEEFNSTLTPNNKDTVKKVNINDETLNPSNVINVVKSEHKSEDNADELGASDFDDFQDVISDNEQDEAEYLKVPLVIHEDGDDGKKGEVNIVENEPDGNLQDKSVILMVVGSDKPSKTELNDVEELEQNNTIDVKITLGNSPLEIITSLSSSTFSLASSDKSLDETNNKKRPVNHSKGRAPPPPPDVMPGHYYDHVTKKHFKETEL